MPVSTVHGGTAIPTPQSNPMQAPANAKTTPKDHTAAKQTPGETRAALKNVFGNVQPSDAKVPDNAPTYPGASRKHQPMDDAASPGSDAKAASAGDTKSSATSASRLPPPKKNVVYVPGKAPAADPKLAQESNGPTTSPVDTRVQAILDTRLPNGKSVKEKLDDDAPSYIVKAAQGHYDRQAENGEPLDAVSKFYLNSTAKYMAENGVKADDISPESLAEVFDKDRINRNLEELANDPVFAKWASEQQANAIEDAIKNNADIAKLVEPARQEGENYVNALRRMQSDYVGSQEFADAVATAKTTDEGRSLVADAMNALSSLGLGEKEMLGTANTLAENIRSKYMPDAPRVMIDPNTNKPIQTDDGDSLAQLSDGIHVALDEDGGVVADKQGHPYVYHQDGTSKLDAGNAYVQYHATAKTTFASYGGIKYLVGPDGKGRFDAPGNPLVIDNEGGAPVTLGADGKVAVDAQGNKSVIDLASGKQVVAPDTGNKVVIDPKTKGIVQAGADGKAVAAENGDPYAVDQKTGAFVKDASGRYVMLSKENAAPGIVPGYVVDENNTKIVVSASTGKPVLDPGLGKTVILGPVTNAPEVVPLDASGRPQGAEDGSSIVYDQVGNAVVRGDGRGPNRLVTADGKYAHDGNGHYIGVGPKNGHAYPVDAKGAPVQSSNGIVPLWDPKTNAMMVTASSKNPIVLNRSGDMLVTTTEGKILIEEKTAKPFLIDPRTREVAVNPETGRSIMLDDSGSPFEFNADDGFKYLINPASNKTVKTAEGHPVIIFYGQARMPVALNPDRSLVRNPDTGNTVVYDTDGKAAVDRKTGGRIELMKDFKPSVIDPKTLTPLGAEDKSTGGLQLYNKDGTDQVNPATGNKVQLDINGHRVEVDPATGKFASDALGRPVILGPDNAPLETPGGNIVVVDPKNGAPIAVDAAGTVEVEPKSGLPRYINTETGKALETPEGKASVVVDPATGMPVQVDPGTGAPMLDPVTGLNILANAKTGEQVKGPNGEGVGLLAGYKLPVYFNKQNNSLSVADPLSGKEATNPKTGAEIVIDPKSGVPVQVLPDQDGNLMLVDNYGRAREDSKGNILYLDKASGQVTIMLPGGKMVDPVTNKEPEAADALEIVRMLPYPPPIMYTIDTRRKREDALPDMPLDENADPMPTVPAPSGHEVQNSGTDTTGTPALPGETENRVPPTTPSSDEIELAPYSSNSNEIPDGMPGPSNRQHVPDNPGRGYLSKLFEHMEDGPPPSTLPANYDSAPVNTPPIEAAPLDTPAVNTITPVAKAAASKWAVVGSALGYLSDGFSASTGVLQAVAGGYTINDGIKNKNAYDIASGAFNVASGALNAASSLSAIIGGAIGAAALPLAAASFFTGTVAVLIDFANSLDDDEQFADDVGKKYEPLGILKDGWRPKAEAAHRDGYTELYQPNYQG